MSLIDQTNGILANPPKAGFFVNPDFVFPDGISLRQIIAQDERNATGAKAAKRAEAHRLVKAAKSPTQQNPVKTAYGMAFTDDQLARTERRAKLAAWGPVFNEEWQRLADIDYRGEKPDGMLHFMDKRDGEATKEQPLPVFDPSRIGDDAEQTHRLDLTTGELIRIRHAETGTGTKAVVEKRDWADEYRIRTKVDMALGALPPEQCGPRFTKCLTMEGARKISESCRFMALKHGGFSTFLTLTLDSAARCRVEGRSNDGPCTELDYDAKKKRYRAKVTHLIGNHWIYAPGEAGLTFNPYGRGGVDLTFQTVQKELSRFWDSAQKMYQRGWVQEWKGKEHRGEAHKGEKLQYCWVVENPKNENGQDNPHIHVLMKWRVPYRDFEPWAHRLESLWGQGFAHLEKIKDPECAGSYMAKAAGYMTKGAEDENGESNQGIVRGNRYGISAEARAPEWEIVGIYENGLMGTLIRDVYDHFTFAHGSKIQIRNRLKEMLSDTPKEESQKRQKIGKALEKVRQQLNKNPDIPHRPSKYQLVITGVHKVAEFFAWAKDKAGRVGGAHSWLPSKERGAYWSENEKPQGPYLHEMRRRIWREKTDRFKGMCADYWAAVRAGTVPDWADIEEAEPADYMLA